MADTPGKNLVVLTGAKLPDSACEFTLAELEAIESLSDQEVNAILSAREKLGDALIAKAVPHCMMF
jgi:hypothetical protein